MANKKSSVLQAQVIALSARGKSGRAIARELAIDKRTVSRILGSAEAQRIAGAILREAGVMNEPEKPPKADPPAPDPDAPPPGSIRAAHRC